MIVGALAVTNPVGNIVDPETGRLIAGPRDGAEMLDLAEIVERRPAVMTALIAARPAPENTTLVCVATNVRFDHATMQRLAFQAHDGLARTIVPLHTFADGDVAFAIAMNGRAPEPDDALVAGILAVKAVERAVLKSVRLATSVAGVPVVRA